MALEPEMPSLDEGENPEVLDFRSQGSRLGPRRPRGLAIDLDVPAPVITLSLIERLRSRDADSYSDKLLAAMRNQFGGHGIEKE